MDDRRWNAGATAIFFGMAATITFVLAEAVLDESGAYVFTEGQKMVIALLAFATVAVVCATILVYPLAEEWPQRYQERLALRKEQQQLDAKLKEKELELLMDQTTYPWPPPGGSGEVELLNDGDE